MKYVHGQKSSVKSLCCHCRWKQRLIQSVKAKALESIILLGFKWKTRDGKYPAPLSLCVKGLWGAICWITSCVWNVVGLIWDLSLSYRQGRFKRSNSVTAAVQADLEFEDFPLMEDKGLQFGGGFHRHSEPSTPTQYGAVRTVRTQGLFSYREDYRTPSEPPSPQRSPEPWLEPSPREPIATVAVTVTPPQPTDSGRASPSCRRDGSWFMQLLHTETKKMEGWCKELEGEAEENDLSEESELTERRFHKPLNLYIIIFVWWRVWLQVSKCQVWIQRSVTFNGETLAELQVIRVSRWEYCHVSNYACQHLSGFHGKELRGSEQQTEGDNAQKWMGECNGVWNCESLVLWSLWEYEYDQIGHTLY